MNRYFATLAQRSGLAGPAAPTEDGAWHEVERRVVAEPVTVLAPQAPADAESAPADARVPSTSVEAADIHVPQRLVAPPWVATRSAPVEPVEPVDSDAPAAESVASTSNSYTEAHHSSITDLCELGVRAAPTPLAGESQPVVPHSPAPAMTSPHVAPSADIRHAQVSAAVAENAEVLPDASYSAPASTEVDGRLQERSRPGDAPQRGRSEQTGSPSTQLVRTPVEVAPEMAQVWGQERLSVTADSVSSPRDPVTIHIGAINVEIRPPQTPPQVTGPRPRPAPAPVQPRLSRYYLRDW